MKIVSGISQGASRETKKFAMSNGIASKQVFMASEKLTVQDQLLNVGMHRSYGNWNSKMDFNKKMEDKDLKSKALPLNYALALRKSML